MKIEKDTLYSFTYNNEDYFFYNEEYYKIDNTQCFIRTLDKIELSKAENFHLAYNHLYINFLSDLYKNNLIKYRIVKYKGFYYYFDRFMDFKKEYCELIFIDKSLIHLTNVDINKLIVIGNNNDEAIRESKLIIFYIQITKVL